MLIKVANFDVEPDESGKVYTLETRQAHYQIIETDEPDDNFPDKFDIQINNFNGDGLMTGTETLDEAIRICNRWEQGQRDF